jgi:hypothetical protein
MVLILLRCKGSVNASGVLINKPLIANYQSIYLKIQSTTCFGPWTIFMCCPYRSIYTQQDAEHASEDVLILVYLMCFPLHILL